MSIRDVALISREAHVRSMSSIGVSAVNGSCLLGSIFLREALAKFCQLPRVIVRGGGGGDGGYRDKSGVVHGHYWVEVHDGEQSWIVDITADQFGEVPVVILAADEASQYQPGNQDDVDSHVAEVFGQIINTKELSA